MTSKAALGGRFLRMAETLAESLRLHDPIDGTSRGERVALLLHEPPHVLDITDDDHSMDPNLAELLGDRIARRLGLAR